MDVFLHLLVDRSEHCRMSIAQAVHSQAAEEIQVHLSASIVEHHAFAANDVERQSLVGMEEELVLRLSQRCHDYPFENIL